jgi:hypothetical protein
MYVVRLEHDAPAEGRRSNRVPTIDDRIPQMSETELSNLQANATRLSASGTAAQKAEAERILPMIKTALEAAKATKLATQQKTMADRREAMAAARKKKADVAKAKKAEAAEAASAADSDAE